jgi:hypothetical protein
MTRFEWWQLRTWHRLSAGVREAAPLPVLEHVDRLEAIARVGFPRLFCTGELVTAAIVNAEIRENLSAMVEAITPAVE